MRDVNVIFIISMFLLLFILWIDILGTSCDIGLPGSFETH